jgi:hypothetical protein
MDLNRSKMANQAVKSPHPSGQRTLLMPFKSCLKVVFVWLKKILLNHCRRQCLKVFTAIAHIAK